MTDEPRNAGDVPTAPIIRLMAERQQAGHVWTCWWDGLEDVMPQGTPRTVRFAKMRRLYRKGLLHGCLCGCSGQFELTQKGLECAATIEETA